VAVAPAALADALQGRYVLERELGRGGMATVYLARDVKHDREVALKLLRPELAAVLGTSRFLQEIRISAKLKHAPLKDLCALGGWKSPQTVLTCYQRADAVSMQQALAARRRLEA
jgi:serine/threonine-protein kinase